MWNYVCYQDLWKHQQCHKCQQDLWNSCPSGTCIPSYCTLVYRVDQLVALNYFYILVWHRNLDLMELPLLSLISNFVSTTRLPTEDKIEVGRWNPVDDFVFFCIQRLKGFLYLSAKTQFNSSGRKMLPECSNVAVQWTYHYSFAQVLCCCHTNPFLYSILHLVTALLFSGYAPH